MVENKHRLPDEAQMGREAYGSKEAKDQRKKRRKKRRLWTVVFWVAIVVLVGCGGVLGRFCGAIIRAMPSTTISRPTICR